MASNAENITIWWRHPKSATKSVKFFAGCCYISRQLFSKTVTSHVESLRHYFVQLTGWALMLSKSETSQFISDLVFDIVNYMHYSSYMEAKCCWADLLEYWLSLNFCVAKFLWASTVPESTDFGNIIPITRLRPNCCTLCKLCQVIIWIYIFKITHWKWTALV